MKHYWISFDEKKQELTAGKADLPLGFLASFQQTPRAVFGDSPDDVFARLGVDVESSGLPPTQRQALSDEKPKPTERRGRRSTPNAPASTTTEHPTEQRQVQLGGYDGVPQSLTARILDQLRKTPGEAFTVLDIAAALDTAPKTVSSTLSMKIKAANPEGLFKDNEGGFVVWGIKEA